MAEKSENKNYQQIYDSDIVNKTGNKSPTGMEDSDDDVKIIEEIGNIIILSDSENKNYQQMYDSDIVNKTGNKSPTGMEDSDDDVKIIEEIANIIILSDSDSVEMKEVKTFKNDFGDSISPNIDVNKEKITIINDGDGEPTSQNNDAMSTVISISKPKRKRKKNRNRREKKSKRFAIYNEMSIRQEERSNSFASTSFNQIRQEERFVSATNSFNQGRYATSSYNQIRREYTFATNRFNQRRYEDCPYDMFATNNFNQRRYEECPYNMFATNSFNQMRQAERPYITFNQIRHDRPNPFPPISFHQNTYTSFMDYTEINDENKIMTQEPKSSTITSIAESANTITPLQNFDSSAIKVENITKQERNISFKTDFHHEASTSTNITSSTNQAMDQINKNLIEIKIQAPDISETTNFYQEASTSNITLSKNRKENQMNSTIKEETYTSFATDFRQGAIIKQEPHMSATTDFYRAASTSNNTLLKYQKENKINQNLNAIIKQESNISTSSLNITSNNVTQSKEKKENKITLEILKESDKTLKKQKMIIEELEKEMINMD